MHEFAYQNNELMVEELRLLDVAEEHGTPLYVYSRRSIVDHCRYLERAFGGFEHLTLYAAKANSNRALLSIISREGLGVDVGSAGELALARASGFPPGVITYSGVGKRDDEMRYALREGIRAFNVESREEIEILSRIAGQLGTTAALRVRVNLDIEAGTHAYIATGRRDNKFGVGYRYAAEILRWASSLPHLRVCGIHSHLGSQIVRVEAFTRAAEMLAALVHDLRASGIGVDELDFGGGFGVQYRGYVHHPALPEEEHEEEGVSAAAMVRTLVPLLKNLGCRISIQPGRSVIAHAGVLLTRVLYRKETEEKVFIVVDGGMNDLIRPSLYQAYHQIVPLRVTGSEHETVDVVGPLCESGDFFALGRRLPRVGRGEHLAVMCTGAYGYVLSSNYNARPRPAEVLVDGRSVTVIRRRETVEDL